MDVHRMRADGALHGRGDHVPGVLRRRLCCGVSRADPHGATAGRHGEEQDAHHETDHYGSHAPVTTAHMAMTPASAKATTARPASHRQAVRAEMTMSVLGTRPASMTPLSVGARPAATSRST